MSDLIEDPDSESYIRAHFLIDKMSIGLIVLVATARGSLDAVRAAGGQGDDAMERIAAIADAKVVMAAQLRDELHAFGPERVPASLQSLYRRYVEVFSDIAAACTGVDNEIARAAAERLGRTLDPLLEEAAERIGPAAFARSMDKLGRLLRRH